MLQLTEKITIPYQHHSFIKLMVYLPDSATIDLAEESKKFVETVQNTISNGCISSTK